ncbi:MAG: hypothetical protein IJ519_02165 [Clostridia bacterium]|nr:hypothetical protein [Clostridia bacterium]
MRKIKPEIIGAEEDGGVRKTVNGNAPKVIASREIKVFYCEFSAYALPEEETRLSGKTYRLSAKIEGDGVDAEYRSHDRYGGRRDRSFTADTSFMQRLDSIVKEYDLALHNGLSVTVYGLPGMYGAELSVDYASGERIYARDNESCFIPIGAMEALEDLFSTN